MKSMLLLVLFFGLIVSGYSAVFLERQHIILGHENQCYEKEEKVFYQKGEEMKWKMKMCGRKICRGSNGKEFVYAETQTCGKVGVPPGCYTKVDLHLPYPNCCEQIVCPETMDVVKNFTDENFSINQSKLFI